MTEEVPPPEPPENVALKDEIKNGLNKVPLPKTYCEAVPDTVEPLPSNSEVAVPPSNFIDPVVTELAIVEPFNPLYIQLDKVRDCIEPQSVNINRVELPTNKLFVIVCSLKVHLVKLYMMLEQGQQ